MHQDSYARALFLRSSPSLLTEKETMGLVSHSYSDDDFQEFLKQLLRGGHLEDSAEGITEKVIEEGLGSLSDKQMFVFEKYVITEFVVEKCRSCSQTIPWCEMYDSYHNGGLCNRCEHTWSSDD